MANKIQVRRGALANLPTLSLGEPALTTDTNRMFIGGKEGNVELATAAWAKDSFSNPNLLINSNFKNAVNQRGQTSYSETNDSAIYTIDRWRIVNSTINISTNGISLSKYSGVPYGVFNTSLEESYLGSIATLSCKVDGVIYSATGTITTALDNIRINLPFGYVRAYNITTARTYVVFISTSDTAYTIEWAKLELGSVATPFVPRPYGEELALCQRYCINLRNNPYKDLFLAKGVAYNPTTIVIYFPLPVGLRANPTLVFDLTKIIFFNIKTTAVIHGATAVHGWISGVYLIEVFTVSGATQGEQYDFRTTEDNIPVIADAEL